LWTFNFERLTPRIETGQTFINLLMYTYSMCINIKLAWVLDRHCHTSYTVTIMVMKFVLGLLVLTVVCSYDVTALTNWEFFELLKPYISGKTDWLIT